MPLPKFKNLHVDIRIFFYQLQGKGIASSTWGGAFASPPNSRTCTAREKDLLPNCQDKVLRDQHQINHLQSAKYFKKFHFNTCVMFFNNFQERTNRQFNIRYLVYTSPKLNSQHFETSQIIYQLSREQTAGSTSSIKAFGSPKVQERPFWHK